MIVYDGVSLESVANVKIVDVMVSSIDYEQTTRPRAILGGSQFVRNRAGTRTVAITFALLDDNKVNRQASLMAISTWAKTNKEYRLDLPGHPEHYLMAVCTDKPDPSLRQWWESKLRLVFTCYDNPYWNSTQEKSVSTNTQFVVLGDAPPLMRIVRNVAATINNPGYTLDDRTISFTSFSAGQVVIDMNKQLVTLDGVSIMSNYKVTSKFIVPRIGVQTITGGAGTIYYRERWQ